MDYLHGERIPLALLQQKRRVSCADPDRGGGTTDTRGSSSRRSLSFSAGDVWRGGGEAAEGGMSGNGSAGLAMGLQEGLSAGGGGGGWGQGVCLSLPSTRPPIPIPGRSCNPSPGMFARRKG